MSKYYIVDNKSAFIHCWRKNTNKERGKAKMSAVVLNGNQDQY